MKLKTDLVTNSSSTAYIIHNTTSHNKTIVDFVNENPELVEEYIERYSYKDSKYNRKAMLESAKKNNITLKPGRNYIVFGDEDGTLIGCVYDYMLRDGGESKSFTWRWEEFLR